MKTVISALERTGLLMALLALCVHGAAFAQENTRYDELFEMSFEELMNLKIRTGTLTGMSASKAPVSVTSICAEEIAATPARNMPDILEIYVPGATFVSHFNGPRIGMRGISGDQNYSFLLLVNGKNMNLKTSDGPIFEIQNRDMNDIQRIDIIQGPGSVTYGPGAIGGIINVITKSADTAEGFKIGVDGNERYRYGTGYASYGYKGEHAEVYLYGSISRSRGEKDSKFFYVDRAHGYGYGFMSPDWGNKGLGSDAPHMYGDYRDDPEVKLQFDMRLFDAFRLWARYTTFNHIKVTQEGKSAEGPVFSGLYGKSFAASLENEHKFSKDILLRTELGFDSMSMRDISPHESEPFDAITRRRCSYSENEISLQSTLNLKFGDRYRFALGGALSYEYWGPEWGMDDDTFLLKFRGNANNDGELGWVVLDPDSPFRKENGGPTSATVTEDDIDAYTCSAFGEANLEFHKLATLLLSARADKHEYADWAFSPRIALISELNPKNILKAIWQRSVRLQTFVDLYSEDRMSGSSARPEVLEGFELIYDRVQGENLHLTASAFHNTIDQVSWLPTEHAGISGQFRYMGLEAEARYTSDYLTIGMNQSFIRQLDWDPVVDIPANLTTPEGDAIPLEGYAESNINNLPQYATKLFANIRLPYDLSLHLNARVFWGIGQKKLVDQLVEAHDKHGSEETRNEMNAIADALRDAGYGEPSFTLNMSLGWKFPISSLDAKLSVYAMNLLSVNNIRYVIQYYEPLSWQYPRHCGFIEEPTIIGMKVDIAF